ncbi:MAG TPA: transglycosylase domain-containing protein [Actinopolymorphaceae bacterium]
MRDPRDRRGERDRYAARGEPGRRAGRGRPPGRPGGPGGPEGPDDPDGPGGPGRPGGPHGPGKKRRRPLRTALIVLGFTFVIGLVGSVAAFAIGYANTKIPDDNELVTSNTSIVYYSDGKTRLGTFAAQNRISVDLADVPKHVQDAVIAAENNTFWTDKGVDPIGIARAALSTAGGSKQGASTITQQYVKNFYLTPERTWKRKINELFITLKVQRELSKETILQRYLNTSFFGRGCWGIQTAAQAYFGKDVKDLSVEEGAVLAAMLKAPSNYDPYLNDGRTKRLEGRFRWVLANMEEMKVVEKGISQTARLPKINPLRNEKKYAGPKGYLLMAAREAVMDLGYDEQQLERGGLRITTTFDAKAQKALEKAVEKSFPKKKSKGVHVGVASVRPGTGELVAMYGGKDYTKHSYNDALQAQIQPGSTFKAFGLVAALEQGLSLQSRFAGNTPYWVGDRHTDADRVVNLDNKDYGRYVDLVKATENSINTAFVDMVENNVGAKKVLDVAVRAGVPENAPGMDQVVPKAVLGQASVRPVDMANAYATFAAGGYRAERHLIAKVTDSNGVVKYEAKPEVEQVFEPDVVREVTWALQRVVTHGSGKREASKIDRPAAGKTGTHEKETSWFVGYTPQLSTAVAFYKDEDWDGTKESLVGVGGEKRFTGGEYPARLWATYMKSALEGEPVQDFPPRTKIGKALNPKPTKDPRTPRTPTPGPSTTRPDPSRTPDPSPTIYPGPDPSPTTDPDPDPDPDPEPTPPPGPDPDPRPSRTAEPPPDPRPTLTKPPPFVHGGGGTDDGEYDRDEVEGGWSDPGWAFLSILPGQTSTGSSLWARLLG